MSDFIDLRLEPALWLLGDWSLRWAVLIAALGIWFALCPPRQAALRLAACQFVLVAGLALPLVPHWWGHELLPARWFAIADDVASEGTTTESPDPLLLPSISKPKSTTAASASRPAVGAEADGSQIPAVESSSGAVGGTDEPLGARRIFLLIVAVLWSVGVCVQFIRLIAGAIGLSRLPRSALHPNPQAQELFDRCCKEMGLRRRVQLRIHPALTAPVFVGGWRSWVLVPTDWEQLDPEAQRAVLWHELAHVARHDDWTKLGEETIRAVFFFHPSVYWLLNRVDAYREQVCDATAVQRGVAGRRLAQILVDFSRRSSALATRESAMHPALPFFRRRTVKNRIRELLEEKTVARWSAPLVRHQFVGLTVIAVATGVALGGFGPHAAGSQAAPLQLAALDPPGKSPSSPAPEKAPATTKGAALPTLERILANWKVRQERTRSVYFAWESRMFFGEAAELRSKGKAFSKQADARSRIFQFSFWAEQPDRFRFDGTPLTIPKPAITPFAVKMHSVINGRTELSVEDPGNAAGSPVSTVSTRRGPWQWIASTQMFWTLNGLTMTIRPLDAFVRRQESQFRVVNENALIDGVRCVELQSGDEDSTWVERCWVDPARDDVIVAYDLQFQRKDQLRPIDARAVSIQYQRDPVHGWVPARWTFKQSRELSENTVTKYAINEPIPEETFSLKLAPGTVVFDERTREQYRIAKDGSKSDVLKSASLVSLKTQRVLESKTDFRIEPQSLKDALDFIAARYQIPINWNQREFAGAGIDLSSEVQFPRDGVAVADLLKTLLAQCQKPVGFRIENEVLTISPKFTEHGALRVRPAPPLPKTASRKERKIQEALEMPVDFNIEPQSLKDALDYIGARYQIRIESDPLMDSLVEVHGSYPGIKLRSLLSILLEQCPGKPLGFKIERDALQIYPDVATN